METPTQAAHHNELIKSSVTPSFAELRAKTTPRPPRLPGMHRCPSIMLKYPRTTSLLCSLVHARICAPGNMYICLWVKMCSRGTAQNYLEAANCPSPKDRQRELVTHIRKTPSQIGTLLPWGGQHSYWE